jgi:hypothetical protein
MLPPAVFGIWAAGPFLQIAGHGTPLWMPAVLLRWIPLVANARIPARAIIVVYLAAAVWASFGARRLLRASGGGRWLLAVLALLVLLDYAPAQTPVVVPSHPAILRNMRGGTGAVLQVPFGLRDGFGETGTLDAETMWLQTIHQRPIAGGFIARLPRDAGDRYRQLPVLGSMLRLSGGEPLTEGEIDADRLAEDRVPAQGFAYVLVNRARASAALEDYVRQILPDPPVAEDADYTLYDLGDHH